MDHAPHIGVVDDFHSNFFSFSTSAAYDGEILPGRPQGGPTVLWHKCIETVCQIITFEVARLLSFKIHSNAMEMLTLSVYQSHFSLDNVDMYHMYVDKAL